MSKGNENKQMTAAQRLLRLEEAVSIMDQLAYNQANQLSMVRDALTLLNEKVNAMVTLLSLGQEVNDSNLDKVVEQKRVEDMKKKVSELLESGSLKKAEEVSKKSFLVVREINTETGAVINPRLQFVVSILNEESLGKLLGKKAGDSVKFVEDNPASIEIEEIYDVVMKDEKNETVQQSAEPLVQEAKAEKPQEQVQLQ
jgi:hypothetical protein